jgi:hypothetical protein
MSSEHSFMLGFTLVALSLIAGFTLTHMYPDPKDAVCKPYAHEVEGYIKPSNQCYNGVLVVTKDGDKHIAICTCPQTNPTTNPTTKAEAE